MHPENRQRLYLSLIMVLVAVGVGAISTHELYQAAIEERRLDLVHTVQSQARLIEAVAEFDSQNITNYPGGTREATLSQIREAHKNHVGFGTTGEFVLAELEENRIVFLLRHRHGNTSSPASIAPPTSIPLNAKLAEPMRRALKGGSGTVVALDYRGETVLAAFEPVEVLKLGLVAKIDLSEIKAPFIEGGVKAGFGGIIIILLGTYAFIRTSEPLIKNLKKHNLELSNQIKLRIEAEERITKTGERLDLAIRATHDGIWDWPDVDKDEMWWSPRCYALWGYNNGEIPASIFNFFNLIHRDDLSLVQKALKKHFDDRELFNIEFRLKTKSGQHIWVRSRGEAVFDPEGNPLRMTGVIQDITKHKQIGEVIRLSEQRFRTIFGEAPLGIAVIDSITGKIYEVNSRFAEIAGRTKEEMSTIDWMSITHPDDVQEDLDNMALLNAGKITGFSMNKRYRRPDNSYVWINMTIAPMTVSDKSCPRHLAMIEDITERKMAEESIRILSRAVEQSPASILITDEKGNIEYVNPSFTQATGYQKEEVLGKNPHVLKSGETPPEEYQRLWKTITSGKTWYGVFHNKKKDGTLFWESAAISPIKDASNKTTHYLGIKEDITHKKIIEEKLLESEKRFRSLVDQAMDAIYVYNAEGKFIHANRRACSDLGYTLDELLQMNVIDIEDAMQAHELHDLWKETETNETITVEHIHKRKNGSTFPVEVNIGQITLDGSTHHLAFAKNVTARIEAQEQLEMAQNHAINSEKLAAIGQLAAGVSHEVLNPVNIISVHSQMLQRKRPQDQEIQVHCLKVGKEIDRIQKIMQTLLKFSRKGEGDHSLIQPLEITNEIMTLVEQDFTLDNIQVVRKWHLGTESAYIQGDRDKLRQVFLNIINNAKHAMAEGGTLTLGSTLTTTNGKDYLRLNFSDTGTGIQEKLKNRIFEPFFSTKPEGKGTGLGLSLVHRIIKDHEGSIQVESEEGKGTSFIIDLPIARKDQEVFDG